MENNAIAVTAGSGTITISTLEYRQLVTAKAYLDVLLETQKGEKSYVVDNTLEVISRCANTVITADEPVSDAEGCVTNA